MTLNIDLQVMADIVSSLLDEKNTPAFEATDMVLLLMSMHRIWKCLTNN